MNWSTANKLGLVLLAIAGVANFIPPPAEAEGGPPKWVLIAGFVLGAIAIAGVIGAWAKGSRNAAIVAVVASVLNALLAVPALFVDGVPDLVCGIVAVFIAWTAVAVWLTLKPNRAG
jgi:hypothetical protein